MNLDRLLGCAAPLVFSDPDGENPFFGGTCFRAKFEGACYAVTARHCIENHHVELATTRIECGTPERTFFPLRAWHLFDSVSTEDTDCGDIAIFETDLERMTPDEIVRIPFLDVEKFPLPARFAPGWRVLVEGFPSRLQDIDYDGRRWVRGSEKLEARYEGFSEFRGTSKLSFLEVEKATKLDGVSGAPVFAFEQLDPKTVRAGFAGMMVRQKYFINSDVVTRALKKVRGHQRVVPANSTLGFGFHGFIWSPRVSTL